jgi:cyclic pyranopterin phosphate synthase
MLVVGFACNNNCRFCTLRGLNRSNNRSTQEIKKTLEDYPLRRSVSFSGGEPTIRKDIFELVSYAKQLGFEKINMETNGRMLYYKNFTQKLIDVGVDSFTLTFVGHTPELHDFLTGIPGSFNQLVKGVKNIREDKSKRVYIMVHFVLMKQNYQFLPQIVNFLLDLDVDYVKIMFCHPIGGSDMFFDEFVPRITDIIPFLKESLDIGIRRNKPVIADNLPFCILPEYEKYFISFSKDFRRVAISIGVEKFNSMLKKRLSETIKGEKCKSCKFDKVCDGLFKRYSKEYGFSEIKPIQ